MTTTSPKYRPDGSPAPREKLVDDGSGGSPSRSGSIVQSAKEQMAASRARSYTPPRSSPRRDGTLINRWQEAQELLQHKLEPKHEVEPPPLQHVQSQVRQRQEQRARMVPTRRSPATATETIPMTPNGANESSESEDEIPATV